MRSSISIKSQRWSYSWLYQGRSLSIAYETLGQGSPVLLLPAFSTVSSRTEMMGIVQLLSPHFRYWFRGMGKLQGLSALG